MLSRTANGLYWLGRYFERAENVARMLDVNFRSSLLPASDPAIHDDWSSALAITGTAETFFQTNETANADAVIAFMAQDRGNPNSILSCLYRARENARALRGSITSEMWESMNETWLEAGAPARRAALHSGQSEFFDWVKERSHLFRGVTAGTMMRNDAFHFLRLGTFLERADATARLLDVKYHMLLPAAEDVGGVADFYQWAALLRSVSALRAYRRMYHTAISPFHVAELLVLHGDMPRSLHASMREINTVFDELRELYRKDYECFRLAGETYAQLRYGRMTDIFGVGLHEFLTRFVERTARIGDQIAVDFQLNG